MQIQSGTPSIATGLPRPDSGRIGGRPSGPSRGGGAAEAAGGFAVPARAAGVPEAQIAIAANFAEEARPARTLPRGSLVDLVI
jgi:hypothetical protein